jgi:hypothetical protein
MLPYQFVHSCHQPLFFLKIAPRSVTLRAARLPQHSTRPTLRHVLALLNVLDGLSTPRRAQ